MAHRGQVIRNEVTGERIGFRRTASDTGGAELEIEATWNAAQVRPPEHSHPSSEETVEVVKGGVTAIVAGETREVGEGERVTIPAGATHLVWNADDRSAAHVIVSYRPALRMEEFIERSFALASSMQDREGNITVPALGALSELLAEFRREFAIASLPDPDADRPRHYLKYARRGVEGAG